jgi:hypothetical protein
VTSRTSFFALEESRRPRWNAEIVTRSRGIDNIRMKRIDGKNVNDRLKCCIVPKRSAVRSLGHSVTGSEINDRGSPRVDCECEREMRRLRVGLPEGMPVHASVSSLHQPSVRPGVLGLREIQSIRIERILRKETSITAPLVHEIRDALPRRACVHALKYVTGGPGVEDIGIAGVNRQRTRVSKIRVIWAHWNWQGAQRGPVGPAVGALEKTVRAAPMRAPYPHPAGRDELCTLARS